MRDVFSVLDAPTVSFLERLRNIRNSRGFSLEYVASKLGFDAESLRLYENGNVIPKVNVLMKLAEFYEEDMSESINGKYFNGKINSFNIKRFLRRYGLTINELSVITGYPRSVISKSIRMKKGGSLLCLFAVLKVIEDERCLSKFRCELCREMKQEGR